MHEAHVEWHPAPGIAAPCGGVDVEERDGVLTLTLRFSAVVGGTASDLRLTFGRVIAFMSHEEFAHPWMDSEVAQPRLRGDWSSYTFPCLEVEGSAWLASFGETRLFGRGHPRHFQVVTLDKSVDILTTQAVQATWLAG